MRTPSSLHGGVLPHTGSDKRPFDIDLAFERIRKAVVPFKPAALFELADDGYRSVFQQLVACIISIRTRDETTIPTVRGLFAMADTPGAMLKLSIKQIDDLIRACSFHEPKARQIRRIAHAAVEEYGGELPCDGGVLMSFAGVGPKCANLVLGIACNQPRIAVDIHVHRVTNRWGYISASTPEKSMLQLEEKLPRQYWVEINRLLVPFGKHLCTGQLPHCSTCPVLEMCRQVGVGKRR